MKKKYMGIVFGLMLILLLVAPAVAAEVPADDTAVMETEIMSEEPSGDTAGTETEITAEEPDGDAEGAAEMEETSPPAGDGEKPEDAALPETEPMEDDIHGTDDQVISGIVMDSAGPAGDEESPDEPEDTDPAEGAENAEEAEEAEAIIDDYSVSALKAGTSGEEEQEDDPVVAVTGVSLNKTKLTIKTKDQTIQLAATVKPSDASDPGVTWSSSDASVVKVDKNGKLTAVKDGTARITVTTTDGNYTAECTVTVSLYSDGFHQDPDGSDWCYYKGGKIATGKTDLIKGTVNGTSGYWNVVKGRVVTSATVAKGTVSGTEAWWYVNKKGMVDTTYTGFATNSSGSWYAEDGKVTKKTNGVIKDEKGALGSSSAWYYVLNSKVQTGFTGLADYKNASGWWYITNGKVDRTVTTIAKNKNGWYYVRDGKVDKTYTGFGTNSSGSWYVENGKVSKKVNGVLKDTTGALGSKSSWYYVLNSKVQTGFTGLADYKNASGWWYITNGKVDRSYTGLAKNKNGWWYVKNGKVDQSYTGTAKNSNGWWYVEKGKVDKSVVALVKVDGVYQAYKSGKFDTGYTGIAGNGNGMWYAKNGVLDRTYSGTYTDDSGTWTVINGKATFSGDKGWVKVGSDYYYFDRSTGKMAKNTTVDGVKVDSSGKAKASSDDIYRIQTMIRARDLMESLTSTGDSQSTKLRKCFDWTVDMSYHRIRYASQTRKENPDTWTCIFANDAFDNGSGTCYTQACAFAYLAKECGYEVDICDDTGHAWVEIDGLVYDPDSARSNFNKYYGTTPKVAGRNYIYITAI